MHDVISIGSVTQDTYISSPEVKILKTKKGRRTPEIMFQFGTKIELDSLQMEVGGGATNAAATFSNFNLRSAVIAECGDDPTGEYVLRELRKLGITTRHVTVENKQKTAYGVFFLGPKGERTIFIYRGASRSLNINKKQIEALSAKWIYLTSVAGDKKTLDVIFNAKATGVNIAWNPGKAELKKGAAFLKKYLKSTDILFVNEEESKMLFGTLSKISQIRKIYQGICVITKGSFGSDCYIGNNQIVTKVKPVTPKDTTGAGDAFGSGFVAGLLLRPGDFAYALRAGSANAMSVVQQVGAKHGLIRPAGIKKFSRRISIHTS